MVIKVEENSLNVYQTELNFFVSFEKMWVFWLNERQIEEGVKQWVTLGVPWVPYVYHMCTISHP